MYVLFQINDLIFTFTLITVYFIFLSYLVFHLGYLCHFTCIFLFFSSSQFLPNQIREGKSFNFISFHLFSIKQIKINSIFTFFLYFLFSCFVSSYFLQETKHSLKLPNYGEKEFLWILRMGIRS